MPSDSAYWLISAPHRRGDDQDLLRSVKSIVGDHVVVGDLEIPDLKTGTLSSLLNLSDAMPKYDTYFTQTVSKLLDTIRSLVADDKQKLQSYATVNDKPAEDYVLPTPGSSQGWKWDRSRWGSGGKVPDVVEALNKEMTSIDTIQKQKLQNYNYIKGNLTSAQRKRTGNLSTRSLVGVVKKEDIVQDSEYLETLIVAVPNNLVKDWNDKYERLTSMVVPRSSSKIASDNEFSLQTVTIFKKVKDEFIHKCRENKFHAREFTWDEGAEEKQRQDMADLEAEEKELWSDLLRLSRTNFSEAYQLLVHLKAVRVFVESVLRYGLPAEYSGVIVKPDAKASLKTLKSLSGYFTFLATKQKSEKGSSTDHDVGGEFGAIMDQEYYDFVLFEVPQVPV
ncbi:hypothetical protein NliqN6_0714 [Naganishia liquefaciens]|uniref:V-type proton ATPase subunit C n=1 Tax=Naganishia liquefaciens TaxID=104408 RepID=A0A8H3YDH9_9TREE|nr:hypothetical protein NliqN6_0714 [Naganishia liquefaciens]